MATSNCLVLNILQNIFNSTQTSRLATWNTTIKILFILSKKHTPTWKYYTWQQCKLTGKLSNNTTIIIYASVHVGKGVTGLQTTTNKCFAYYFICRCWFDLKNCMFKKMHWGALLAFQELTKKLQEIIDFIEHYLSFQSVFLYNWEKNLLYHICAQICRLLYMLERNPLQAERGQ